MAPAIVQPPPVPVNVPSEAIVNDRSARAWLWVGAPEPGFDNAIHVAVPVHVAASSGNAAVTASAGALVPVLVSTGAQNAIPSAIHPPSTIFDASEASLT